MSVSCCGPEPDATADGGASEHACPLCGSSGATVDHVTVAALTRSRVASTQTFWLCRTEDCPVVYHGAEGARFVVDELHVVPAFKSPSDEALVCYCFLHTRAEIERELRAHGATQVPASIKREIQAGNCACEVRNPSGRCCLGEVNAAVAEARERLQPAPRPESEREAPGDFH